MPLICRNRVDVEEWIDSPNVPIEEMRRTFHDQEWVNRWLGGGNATWAHAIPFIRSCTSNPIRVLDMACGGADLSRKIVDEALKLYKRVEIIAADLNEKTLIYAQEQSKEYPEISFVQANALQPPFQSKQFDIVILATVMHHLPPEQVIVALQKAQNLTRGILIAADLVRSSLAHTGILAIGHIARFSPISIHDGAISVCRAYTPKELSELADQAGLQNYQIYKHKFYRMALVSKANG